ncbi:MAG: nickel pincer cofactor biosynthesis protein LarC [Proteobacteria bacterium]|nr:nickel pincer cofactor biosynthesis protein LarC [Pseudomonadota bacterium]
MKVAYLDCFSGISGDMFLGALLDAGLPLEDLKKALRRLPLRGLRIETRTEAKNHIHGTRFLVRVKKDAQVPRQFSDIKEIIRSGNLKRAVQDKSIEIFEAIALEESKIHHCKPEEVHFHEVGADDSIVDIVGTVFGMDTLGITATYASPIPLGSGFVETRHGRMPLPAPATIALLKGVPVYDSGLKAELVTPTGAALLKLLVHSYGPMPPMTVERVGYGVGTRDMADRPNLLRILIGREQRSGEVETVVILEANLDDANPEWLGFLMDRLLRAGALDVLFCPVQMKKNRPGILIQVMGSPHQRDGLMEILFQESTTLGVRFRYSERKVLERVDGEIESPWGKMRVKKVLRPDGSFQLLPEYEACRKIAEEKGLPLREIYYWIMARRNTEPT